jgi:hypothetical protein
MNSLVVRKVETCSNIQALVLHGSEWVEMWATYRSRQRTMMGNSLEGLCQLHPTLRFALALVLRAFLPYC